MAVIGVGVEHDLAHFAVESTLRMRRGFYGLLADGMDIQDFDVQGATTKFDIPDEAVHAEFIVGLLQIERRNGEPYAEFNTELRRTIEASRRPPISEPPRIRAEAHARMRSMLNELLERWLGLTPGQSLELALP